MTEQQILQQMEQGVPSRLPLSAKLLKLRFRLWLVLLREISILMLLSENFEKIPKRSLSYYLTKLYLSSSLMRRMISALDKKLRKRIY